MTSSEWVLVWAKRVKAQRAQVAVINSLSDIKNFEIMWQKDGGKQIEKKLATPIEMPTRSRYKDCGVSHQLRQWLAHGKKCEPF